MKRRGKNRALVALQRSMLTAIWHMAATGEVYTDLGADYYRSRDPERTRRHAIAQLEALGYHVTLREAASSRSPRIKVSRELRQKSERV